MTTGPIVVNQGTLILPSGLAGSGPLSVSTVAAGRNRADRAGRDGSRNRDRYRRLFIGNSKQTGQFNQGGSPGVGGTLNVGSNAVVFLSADAAILGSQTNIGPGGSLTALNGAQLGNPSSVDATKILTATGSARSTPTSSTTA